jgi:hypothetical protein
MAWAAPWKLAMGSPAWIIRLRLLGMPTSWLTAVAMSSIRIIRPSLMRVRNLARSSAVVCDQDSKARRAAATALSTSSLVPLGTVAMGSSVVELTTVSSPSPPAATQAPSMKILSYTFTASPLVWSGDNGR